MPDDQPPGPDSTIRHETPVGSSSNGPELTWPGKYDAAGKRRGIGDSANRSMAPGIDVLQTVGSSPRGRLIHGDFRDCLRCIEAGSVDFIYVDPPFGTGRPQRGGSDGTATVEYGDDRSLGAQIELLDDLIMHAGRVLKKTGSIALHLDHRFAAQARCLLDEHFGRSSFVNELIWHYGLGNARASRYFLRKHDNILIYGRSSKYYFNKLRGPVTAAQQQKYCHEDEHGRYMISYGKKYYLKGGKPLDSVLDMPGLGATDGERCGYPTQKPVRLLETLIEALCPESGTVLDPCCGSGTTAVAAQRLGRTWIAIDESATAIQHATTRLQSAEKNPGFTIERCPRPGAQPVEEQPLMASVNEGE